MPHWIVWFAIRFPLVSCVSYEPFYGFYSDNARVLNTDCEVTCQSNMHLHHNTRNITKRNSIVSSLKYEQQVALAGIYDARFLEDSIVWGLHDCTPCPRPTFVNGTNLPTEAYTLDSECALTCNVANHYYQRSQADTCAFCDEAVCGVGFYLTGNCSESDCQPCQAQYADTIFTSHGTLDSDGSCAEQCAPGYFMDYFSNGSEIRQRCIRHSIVTCDTNFFKQAGTHLVDALCLPCTKTCPDAHMMVTTCFEDADAICQPCSEISNHSLQLNQEWNSKCEPVCTQDYVLDTYAGLCDYCPNFKCANGYTTPSTRQNCTHCEKCDNIVIHARYVDGCLWSCLDGYQSKFIPTLNITICEYLPSSEVPVPATTRRNPLLTCSETQFLNDNYICEECTGRGIITPISSQLGVRWRWLYNCKWECLPSYYYFAESDELYYCYTWSEFKAFVQIESGDITQIQNTQSLFQTTNTPTQRQKVLPLFEWILCATIVSTTLLVVMIRG